MLVSKKCQFTEKISNINIDIWFGRFHPKNTARVPCIPRERDRESPAWGIFVLSRIRGTASQAVALATLMTHTLTFCIDDFMRSHPCFCITVTKYLDPTTNLTCRKEISSAFQLYKHTSTFSPQRYPCNLLTRSNCSFFQSLGFPTKHLIQAPSHTTHTTLYFWLVMGLTKHPE